jgi:DNA-binding XRE family transcriptional regulator|tara:strand:- start:1504 stop:1707 length:204 start_codon:yes stop_codon:yes gene_type:complete
VDNNKYRELRESVGSQARVAEVLGINKQTISNRETGKYEIGKEAAWAIRYLAHVKKGRLNQMEKVSE